jgi:hypothetical protein
MTIMAAADLRISVHAHDARVCRQLRSMPAHDVKLDRINSWSRSRGRSRGRSRSRSSGTESRHASQPSDDDAGVAAYGGDIITPRRRLRNVT